MGMHQSVECVEAFEPSAFLSSCIRLSYAGVVIGEHEEVSFCTKSYRHNRFNWVFINELVYSFCSFLRHVVVMLCYFCSLATIAYTFIFNVMDDMASQVFL